MKKKMNDRLEFAKQTKLSAPDDYFNNNFTQYVIYGKNCVVKPSTVIGGYGFGFERDEEGIPQHLYHTGQVILGDNVWVGSNTCIDRGTVRHTIIGDNTKIDNNVQIGHNCSIGKNVIVTAGAVICGSVTIEEGVWVGVNSSIRQGLTVGKGAVIGMGAVVVKDVPAGAVVYGNPAQEKKCQNLK